MIPGDVDIPHADDGPSEARVWGSGGGVGIEARVGRSEGREVQMNRNDVPSRGWRGGDCQPSVSVSDPARGCRCMGDLVLR
jgi:hypothetical protein